MFIWLASYPKSGNTWLRKFLSSYIEGPPFDINKYHFQFESDIREPDYQLICAAPIRNLGLEGQLALRHAALFNKWLRYRCRLYLKTHHSLTSKYGVEYIPSYLTEGAIYLVRDPRDMVISYAHHYGMSLDFAIHCIVNPCNTIHDPMNNTAHHGLGEWNGHVQLWTERETSFPRCAVRYEDLHAEPRNYFHQIIQFLGLDFDQERFDWAIEQTSFQNLQKQEEEKGFNEQSRQNNQFFRKGQPGEWKEQLTEGQRKRIEEECYPMMQKLGYL